MARTRTRKVEKVETPVVETPTKRKGDMTPKEIAAEAKATITTLRALQADKSKNTRNEQKKLRRKLRSMGYFISKGETHSILDA